MGPRWPDVSIQVISCTRTKPRIARNKEVPMHTVPKIIALGLIAAPLLLAGGCASDEAVASLRRDVDALKADVAQARADAARSAAAAEKAAEKADRIYRQSLRK